MDIQDYMVIPMALSVLVLIYAGLVCIDYYEGVPHRSKLSRYIGEHTTVDVNPQIFTMEVPRYRRSISPKDTNPA